MAGGAFTGMATQHENRKNPHVNCSEKQKAAEAAYVC